jgi:hypothetical protein
MLHVVPGAGRRDGLERRIIGPCRPRRPGPRRFRQPQLEALVGGIGRQQPVQRGGAGPRQPGDEDGTFHRDIGVPGKGLPSRLAEQPRH